jgi:uncharacterized protein YndB with AHSA1/START domain
LIVDDGQGAAPEDLMPLNDYFFREHWMIPAPRGRVYDVLSDGKLLPRWWKQVYLEAVPLNGDEIKVGARLRVKARGALPYRLRFILEATDLQQDRVVEVTAHGDFRGVWRATLSDTPDGGTRVDIEWRVTVQKPLIRYFSPLLKPLFAWNHRWTTPRGERGLAAYLAEPIARPRAAVPDVVS